MRLELYRTMNMRRLPLAGAKNARDLGGYACNGGVTRWHVFLRSDCPHTLTETDKAALRAYGVKAALDLRSSDEKSFLPSAVCDVCGFAANHVSLSDQLDTADYEGDTPGSMAGLYLSILDNAASSLGSAVRILAAQDGAAIFHCAVGKDRTGVLAMLLLDAVGVDAADIVADYAMTEVYMREVLNNNPHVPSLASAEDYRAKSIPASMWRALRHLRTNHGGAERYLLSAGVTPEELAALRRKFVDAG